MEYMVAKNFRGDSGKIHFTAGADLSPGDGYVLSGAKTFVLEGLAATQFVVAARTSDNGITLFLVPADSAGVARDRLHTVDSRGYANVRFEGVTVAASQVLGNVDAGAEILEPLLDYAAAGVAAEM